MNLLTVGVAALVCVLGAEVPKDSPLPSPPPPNPLRPEVRWNLPWPDSSKPAAGYRVVDGVEHFEIYRANPEQGVFSHHAHITFHGGVFYAAWSNHVTPDEDGPGQRVLGSISKDGRTWAPAFELFPPLDKNEPKANRTSGKWRLLTDNGWLTVDDTVYAIAEASESGKDGRGRLAREIRPDGTMGSVFWLVDNPPEPLEGQLRIPDLTDPAFTKIAARISRMLSDPLQTRSIENLHHTSWTFGPDGQNLCEPSVYRRPDGVFVKIWRDRGRSKTKRLYASISTTPGYWSPPLQTNIPNSPSKVATGTLSDGRTYIIGNLVTGHKGDQHDVRDPLVLTLSWDGMNFDWAKAIRAGAPPLRFSTLRAPGFAYPSAVVANDCLWVIYSIGKEDVAVSRIPLSALGT
jgi:hypothetical protein